jgi:hypothetical protein
VACISLWGRSGVGVTLQDNLLLIVHQSHNGHFPTLIPLILAGVDGVEPRRNVIDKEIHEGFLYHSCVLLVAEPFVDVSEPMGNGQGAHAKCHW